MAGVTNGGGAGAAGGKEVWKKELQKVELYGFFSTSGDQGQDAGRKGRRVEENARDAGTDAGDHENAMDSWMSIFPHISSNPHLSPIQPSGTNFPSHICILG